MTKVALIHQYKVTLIGPEPAIWRRIQIAASSTFWDLHVAIQDSMGWLDYHLHAFRTSARQADRYIGMPDGANDSDVVASWKTAVTDHFKVPGDAMTYEYDFGDSWTHDIRLEAISIAESHSSYPRCLAGRGACPPEDCGGVAGYNRLIQRLQAPNTEAYDETVSWLSEHAKNYFPYRWDYFEPSDVTFADAKRRLKKATSAQ